MKLYISISLCTQQNLDPPDKGHRVVPMIKIDNFPIALKEEEKEKTLSFLEINRTYSFPSFPLLYVDLLVFQKRKRNKEER